MDGLQVRNYCMQFKKPVTDCAKHEHRISRSVLADDVMLGIVDRLYDLGIEPVMAICTFNRTGSAPDIYHPGIIIQLSEQVTYEMLGELPTGWKYCWNDGMVFSLDYNDWCTYIDIVEAETRLKEVIGEFEAFLDTRDVESTKALMLLTAS